MLKDRGSSLIQVMVAIGLTGTLTVVLMKNFDFAKKQQNTMLKNAQSMQLMAVADLELRSRSACLSTLGDGVRTLTDDVSVITDKNGNELIRVNELYSGFTGAGGKVRVTDMRFARNPDGSLKYNDVSGGVFNFRRVDGTEVSAVTGSVDFEVVFSKEDADSKDSFGGRSMVRTISGLRVVTLNDQDGVIIGCHGVEDSYVEAACAALGGTINPSNGKCDDININSVTADTSLSIRDCGSMLRGIGPAGVPGMEMVASGPSCSKTFLGNAQNSTRGSMGIEGDFYTRNGLITFGDGTSSGTTSATISYDGSILSFGNTAVGVRTFDFGGRVQTINLEATNNAILRAVTVGTNITGSGGTVSGFSAVQTSSDERLKFNFEKIDSALEKILSISGWRFNWKDPLYLVSQNESQIGLSAQEVERVFPELVAEDEDGYKMVNYQGMVAPLIESIKEQNKIIKNQAKLLKELKKEIKLIKEQM